MPVELSILLPAYNVDVRQFVRDLQAQAQQLPIRYEIRVYEDASAPESVNKNREIAELPNVVHQIEPVNLGRARIRNKLARDARYENLLFIDSDSEVPDGSYLKTYFQLLPFEGVLVGASRVALQDPGPEFRLRWLYGKERESKVASTRNLDPYAGFVINNVIIPKAVFLQFSLDESITTYGHEDTAFGESLKLAGIKVVHVDNPVIHTGVEPASEYLEKTRDAVANLFTLKEKGQGTNSKLVRSFEALRKIGMVNLFISLLQSQERRIVENLQSATPSLRLFDLYKLYLFCLQYSKE